MHSHVRGKHNDKGLNSVMSLKASRFDNQGTPEDARIDKNTNKCRPRPPGGGGRVGLHPIHKRRNIIPHPASDTHAEGKAYLIRVIVSNEKVRDIADS